MSLLDSFKGIGKRRGDTELADELSYGDGYSVIDDSPEHPDTIQDASLLALGTGEPGSIISEAAPSAYAARPRPPVPPPAPPLRSLRLPLIGGWPAVRQQRLLGLVLALGVASLALAVVLTLRGAGREAGAIDTTQPARLQAHRVAEAALRLPAGTGTAAELNAAGAALLAELARAGDLPDDGSALVERVRRDVATLAAQAEPLTRWAEAQDPLRPRRAVWLSAADGLLQAQIDAGAAATDLTAAVRLQGALQRLLARSGDAASGADPAALVRDLGALPALLQTLQDGPAGRDAAQRERLALLAQAAAALPAALAPLTAQGPALATAEAARQSLLGDVAALRRLLAPAPAGDGAAGGAAGLGPALGLLVGAGLLLSALGALGLLAVFTREQRQRAARADAQRHEAERQEREAKRVNDANQAAILRLMNELQSVAEGDLTQQATVTEDITGAIADSVNYTVEELRSLVSQVQGTAARVTDTTQQVEATSTELLAASDEQLREIRETGEAVLTMADRIQQVSGQAQRSAEVAHESLSAAASGLGAVQDTISGMNTLREQIQETSKRIKRLGESSQEIGEITELISDITEQTNVLALNAAIQAASAGEAGRGFSVVAEEVQRLAERSADATRQIAALVKAIQTDTADAVAAMERSTQGVVEGARLSDNAGTALSEIDRVSRRLAELIEHIAQQTRRESDSATVVAQNIQHIFAVTEQTGEGTRSTAQLVRQLSRTAEELRQSVARFKIS